MVHRIKYFNKLFNIFSERVTKREMDVQGAKNFFQSCGQKKKLKRQNLIYSFKHNAALNIL